MQFWRPLGFLPTNWGWHLIFRKKGGGVRGRGADWGLGAASSKVTLKGTGAAASCISSPGAPDNLLRTERLQQLPPRSPAPLPGPVQPGVAVHEEGGGEGLYLNATLSRSLRHVSQREGSASSQFFSTFLSSPQPRNAPRPAGRGHLRSFFQHLSRQPPRGSASARAGRAGGRRRGARGAAGARERAERGGGVCRSRRGAATRGAAGRPPALSSSSRGRRPRPPPPAAPPRSLECFPSWKRETERQN